MNQQEILRYSPKELLKIYPFLDAFFAGQNWILKLDQSQKLGLLIEQIDEEQQEDHAFDKADFIGQLSDYINQMEVFMGKKREGSRNPYHFAWSE
jgi:hypothetical protein